MNNFTWWLCLKVRKDFRNHAAQRVYNFCFTRNAKKPKGSHRVRVGPWWKAGTSASRSVGLSSCSARPPKREAPFAALVDAGAVGKWLRVDPRRHPQLLAECLPCRAPKEGPVDLILWTPKPGSAWLASTVGITMDPHCDNGVGSGEWIVKKTSFSKYFFIERMCRGSHCTHEPVFLTCLDVVGSQ